MSERKTPTTAHGISVTDTQNSITAGPRGPVLIEKPPHFNREHVPKRIAHTKGSSVYSMLKVTGDISG